MTIDKFTSELCEFAQFGLYQNIFDFIYDRWEIARRDDLEA